MITTTADANASQQDRLRAKTQDQRLIHLAVEGAGISTWEANVLVDVVKEVYFAEPEDCPLRSGQMRYECVAATEGPGKPIKDCRLVTVVLSLLDKEDDLLGARLGAKALRQHRIMRLTEEAREQGGLLSQEDLARLLFSNVRTIRRDVRELRESCGIVVATRGQQKDIGPGVSHKGVALRHWLEGMEPVEIGRKIHHTLHAVERYIQRFSRVVFLRWKGFAPVQITLTVGISSANVQTYLEIYETYRHKRAARHRFEEMERIGAEHYQAEDAKKGGHLHGGNASDEWRRP